MVNPEFRIERDSLGEVRVPAAALYGAQTQRAIENFRFDGRVMPIAFIHALGLVKAACARANRDLGQLEPDLADAIRAAALAVARGEHDAQFPVAVFQSGSGTSTNMNANEVIANLASRALGRAVSPHDAVNRGQSSNDVIPTALQVAAALAVDAELLPALAHLRTVIERRGDELMHVVKTGRTHLMDAVPLTFGQELSGWQAQLVAAGVAIAEALRRLRELPLGGTAIGTGLNAHPAFAQQACAELERLGGLAFRPLRNRFAGLASPDAAVALSGQLKGLACILMKIANDLRWMNSGPLAGLGEIRLPALQPGSSIMPGKVNPVIPEAVAMVAAQVIGNDLVITVAAQSGNFQLNVMLPVIADNLLRSIALLTQASRALADQAIAGFEVDRTRVAATLNANPILATALNPLVGYARAAEIARRAIAEHRPVLEVAVEMTGLPRHELEQLLDPHRLTGIAE
ncbi:MAG: class II fumarate hydratase [Thiotrichales bacterium]